ncbi:unnamed protein product [Ambrosiozyma monospora]|uniref:Unnamed protein product n=1 Tax=Ambrosiozyma monospora TaxID=43982 RepID=A0ACB5T432_AMBMO|nr:unnamed protein product [Ambrosiozyma monospora]
MAPQQQTLARFFGGSKATEASKKKKTGTGTSSAKSSSSPKTSPKRSPKKRTVSPPSSPESKTSSAEEIGSPTKKQKIKNTVVTYEDISKEITSHRKAQELKEIKEVSELEKKLPESKITINKGSKTTGTKQIPYTKLVEVFNELEAESGRLKNLASASRFFLEVLKSYKDDKEQAATNLIQVTYLMVNRLGPDYEPDLELGLGETLLLKALATSTGRSLGDIRKDFHKQGDIGVVAKSSRSRQSIMFKPKPLTVEQVFQNLKDIAGMTDHWKVS